MTEQNRNKVVFTPEQRRILGQVYQLILNWRRERLNRGGNTTQPKLTVKKGSPSQGDSVTTSPIERVS